MANNVILEGHTWTFRLCQYEHAHTHVRAGYNYKKKKHSKMRTSPSDIFITFLMIKRHTQILNLHTLALCLSVPPLTCELCRLLSGIKPPCLATLGFSPTLSVPLSFLPGASEGENKQLKRQTARAT